MSPIEVNFFSDKKQVILGLKSKDMTLRVDVTRLTDEDDLFADVMNVESILNQVQEDQKRSFSMPIKFNRKPAVSPGIEIKTDFKSNDSFTC